MARSRDHCDRLFKPILVCHCQNHPSVPVSATGRTLFIGCLCDVGILPVELAGLVGSETTQGFAYRAGTPDKMAATAVFLVAPPSTGAIPGHGRPMVAAIASSTVASPDEMEPFTGSRRNVVLLPPVAGRKQDAIDAGPGRGYDLLADATHGQHQPAQTDLTCHRHRRWDSAASHQG